MAWTSYQIFLAFLMASTGSLNTLTAKWADVTEAVGRDGVIGKFNHPFFQACTMFVGEILCLVAFFGTEFYARHRSKKAPPGKDGEVPERPKLKKFNPFVLFPPAMCDLAATSIMFIGLNMTNASSYQMLRGSVIIFTGLLSVAFLNRILSWLQWFGILMVIAGLVVVGVSDMINVDSSDDTNGIITGDLLIVLAMIVSATQMVVEEKFVGKHNIPALLAVGLEGCFGFTVLVILLFPFYFINAGSFSDNPKHRLEDALDAFVQMGNAWQIVLGTVGNVVSIAFFNFAGISVTKEMSATTRMVLDSIRTLVVWAVSLGVKWQTFHWLQIIGFVALIIGMFIYNDIIILPLMRRFGWVKTPAPKPEQNSQELNSVITAPVEEKIDTPDP